LSIEPLFAPKRPQAAFGDFVGIPSALHVSTLPQLWQKLNSFFAEFIKILYI